MNYGIIHGEPSEVYHATDAVGSHKLADFALPNVPLLYYRKYISREAPSDEKSEAFDFGEYFHCLALEGESVADSRYVVEPKFDRRTTAGKAAAAEFEAKNAGKKSILQSDQDLAWRMVKSIREKPNTAALFSVGKPEVVFRHKMASFSIQARADWFDERLDDWQRPLFIDLKTIDHISNFPHHYRKFGYWRQAAFYQLVIYHAMKLQGAFPRVKFVVCEKEEPYQSKVFEPGEIGLEEGRRAVLADLGRLKACYDANSWPGESDAAELVELPDYMLGKKEGA